MPRICTEDGRAEFAQALLDVTGGTREPGGAAEPRGGPTAEALHAYFPNRGDLVQALWWSALDEFDCRAQGASGMEGDPIQPIKALGMAYARFALENPARFRDLFDLDTGRLAAELNSNLSRESTYRTFLKMVADAAAQREIHLKDPELIAQILWAAIHGVFSLINSWPDFPFRSPGSLVSAMMDIMLAGVLATSAPDRIEAGEDTREVVT